MDQTLQNLRWIEELLPDDIVQKRMYGGIAYYLDEKMVLVLVESSRTREYKGVTYPFEIWNGCLFPIDRIKQNAVFAKFSYLENHPPSNKWLYLPADTEEFETKVKELIREIKKKNPLFGSMVKIAKPKRVTMGSDDDEMDFSKPSLFSDEPVVVKPVKKIVKDPKKPVKKVKADKKSGNNLLLSVLKRRNKL